MTNYNDLETTCSDLLPQLMFQCVCKFNEDYPGHHVAESLASWWNNYYNKKLKDELEKLNRILDSMDIEYVYYPVFSINFTSEDDKQLYYQTRRKIVKLLEDSNIELKAKLHEMIDIIHTLWY